MTAKQSYLAWVSSNLQKVPIQARRQKSKHALSQAAFEGAILFGLSRHWHCGSSRITNSVKKWLLQLSRHERIQLTRIPKWLVKRL